MTWWNRKSKPDDEDSQCCPFSGRRGGGMKTKDKIEILHQTQVPIKGNEPFLFFNDTGVIVNLHDRSGHSHNFLDGWVTGSTIPVYRIRKGDKLTFSVARVYQVPMKWYENIISDLRNWWAR